MTDTLGIAAYGGGIGPEVVADGLRLPDAVITKDKAP